MIGNTISKLPLNCGISRLIQQSIVKIPIRHGYQLRGKPFGVAKSLQERLQCKYSYFEVMLHKIFFHFIENNLIFFELGEEEKLKKFEEEKKPVEIGFPAVRLSRSEENKLRFELRQQLRDTPELEKKARKLECM